MNLTHILNEEESVIEQTRRIDVVATKLRHYAIGHDAKAEADIRQMVKDAYATIKQGTTDSEVSKMAGNIRRKITATIEAYKEMEKSIAPKMDSTDSKVNK